MSVDKLREEQRGYTWPVSGPHLSGDGFFQGARGHQRGGSGVTKASLGPSSGGPMCTLMTIPGFPTVTKQATCCMVNLYTTLHTHGREDRFHELSRVAAIQGHA